MPFPRRSRGRPPLTVMLAAPRGFCAGVRRAIAAVTDALATHGAPVYVRRPIVHNLAVVRTLEAQGAVFVEELAAVPRGGVVVLSAHGVAPAVAREARLRGLVVYDAVCPLVAKVHREVERHYRAGRHVILIGHAGHPEIEGTMGHLPPGAATLVRSPADVSSLPLARYGPVAYAVQTTFSVEEVSAIIEAIERCFADIAAPAASDICYATTNRQAAVREIAARVDCMIVVGEDFSSNARRLAEVAAESCRSVQLLASAADLDWAKLPPQGGSVGISAAASTPERSVTEVLDKLATGYALTLSEQPGVDETMRFRPVRMASPNRGTGSRL